jgi:hypothetical protein
MSLSTLIEGKAFTPKGWERSAQGNALGFTPKGWERSAQGNALGSGKRPTPPNFHPEGVGALSPLRGEEIDVIGQRPRALPWAERSHPFGVKTA